MPAKRLRPVMGLVLIPLLFLLGISLACARSVQPGDDPDWVVPGQGGMAYTATYTPFPFMPATRQPGSPLFSPTPDVPHELPSLRTESEQYIVQPGDTLGNIADRFSLSVEQIAEANRMLNPNVLEVGQVLEIPVPTPDGLGLDFKIIPDSELVYGPVSAYFDLPGFIKAQGGYLASYKETINDGEKLSGAEIVQLVAQNYSVNPRLLLAVLEYQSGWVTKPSPPKSTLEYPMGWRDPNRDSLYRQMAWAANNLNQVYYLWRVNGVSTWVLPGGRVIPAADTINAGTAGVQHLFAQLYGAEEWRKTVSPDGLFSVYSRLFGYPFDLAVEPLLPPDLQQPLFQLPFEENVSWAYTSGPHAGWDSGSAWAGLDFAPDTEALGCVQSDAWVTAVGDGVVVRTGDGIVILDINDPNGLPADGLEQTGWVVLYLHIETRDRVEAGTYLLAGDLIGHPSCEGGVSTGTHVHIARRYNGEWIAADQNLPFVLDGWVSIGVGIEYEGYLERKEKRIQADAGNGAKNNTLKR
jgi:LasA protease